jgi:geranylgeranylglycerol-phosphate geranylgeranyltransferase
VYSFPVKKIVILVLAFLSWGINQVINDYLGIPEDRINAPERPMVSGDLNPGKALLVSITLIFISFLITVFYLQPIAIVFLFSGVLLNVLYETAKGYGIIGNIVFGIMISMASLYGFYASGFISTEGVLKEFMPILMLVVIINGLMTFYTYFKDYKGDKKTKKIHWLSSLD